MIRADLGVVDSAASWKRRRPAWRAFDARYRDADEDELRSILADGIGEAYFFRALPADQQQAAVAISDLHFVQFHY
ncbi:hypothetical protein ACFYW6_23910 [Streptomyces sp. NPDC002659]|uniref:hypothetical protein n=1 Tax=Streptomyces sp. NPDC002659 TaxID=3364656 RepID=UPI0036834E64